MVLPLTDILDKYLDKAITYNFTQGPDVVRSLEDARQGGVNCTSLAHLVLKDLFAYELPHELQCFELYLDKSHFTKISQLSSMQRGDLVWFGVAHTAVEPEVFEPVYQGSRLSNWQDFPIKHVAISTGISNELNDPLLLHSTAHVGTNTIWPLSRFANYRNYQRIYGITRLIVDSDSTPSA